MPSITFATAILILFSWGDSIPRSDRERLTFLVRAFGSRVPIVYVTKYGSDCAAFADATISEEPVRLLPRIGELLAIHSANTVTKSKSSPIVES